MLDYLILMAVCALEAADYAAAFWSPLGSGVPEFVLAAGIVVYVAAANARGAGPRRYERAALLVIGDFAVQCVVVVLGLVLLFQPGVLTEPVTVAPAPSASDLLFAFTLAIVAFSGLDASSGLAGEVPIGRRGLRRLLAARLPTLVPYVGIALVASSVLPAERGGQAGLDPIDAPMLALVGAFR